MAMQTRKLSVDPDTPGFDALMTIAGEAMSPIYVTNVKPFDVSYIKDPAVRAIVVLAVSCEWNVVHKPGRMVTVISRTGLKLRFPTNTSIKFGVFTSWANSVVTHSMTHIPTMDLVDKLINQYKLDSSHARVFRDAVGGPVVDRIDLQLEEQVNERLDAVAEAVKEDDRHPEIPDGEVERVEPTLSQATKDTFYVSPLMDTVIRQLVPDGTEQITYRCKVCGLEFETKRGVGGHYQVHIRAGEAEATNHLQKEYVKQFREPAPQVTHVIPPHPDRVPEPEPDLPPIVITRDDLPELTRLRQVVDRIAELVGREHIEQLQERCQELTIERDAAVARAERLASDLRTLRELIGGISSE